MTMWEQGRLIAGRYRLLRRLGSGGSADVWAARDESLDREVAIKSLSGLSTQGGHERERLEREAQLLATLHHPRITTVYDFAETSGPDESDELGYPFLVTELLDGESLSARLDRGPLAPPEARTVCTQVADALATAHGSGVVHRDVKPGNVMLTSRGAVLLDFGISRRDTDADLIGNVVIGTPACMAPEQWRGSGARPASDVYALGCLIFWCLSGHAPYAQRELPALGLAHLLSDPPPLPLTGRDAAEIDAIYQACMRKDPDERPSAREVADSLEQQAAALPTLAIRRPFRRARFAASVAAVGAVLAASIVLPLTQQIDASPASNTPPTSSTATMPSTSTSATPVVSVSTVHDAAVASSTSENGNDQSQGHGHGHGKHGGS